MHSMNMSANFYLENIDSSDIRKDVRDELKKEIKEIADTTYEIVTKRLDL